MRLYIQPLFFRGFIHALRERLAEFGSAAIMASCGVGLLRHPDMFERGSYGGMEWLATQQTWAGLFLSLGLIRLVLLAVNGSLRRSPHLRAALSLISGVVWLQVALAYLQGPDVGLGVYVFFVLWVQDFVAMARASVEAGVADARQEE